MIKGALKQAQAWPGLKRAVVAAGGHAVRIESVAGAGVPDVNLCLQGLEIWVELKYRYAQASALQKVWHKARRLAGGRVVVVTFNPGCVLIQGLASERLAYPLKWACLLSEIVRVAGGVDNAGGLVDNACGRG